MVMIRHETVTVKDKFEFGVKDSTEFKKIFVVFIVVEESATLYTTV